MLRVPIHGQTRDESDVDRHVTSLTYHQRRRAQQASGKLSSFFPVSHVTRAAIMYVRLRYQYIYERLLCCIVTKHARLPQLRLLLIAVGVRMRSSWWWWCRNRPPRTLFSADRLMALGRCGRLGQGRRGFSIASISRFWSRPQAPEPAFRRR